MLLKLSEAEAATKKIGEQAIAIAAGLFASMQTCCNRSFAQRVENVTISGATATLLSFRHGFYVGQSVCVTTDSKSSSLDLAKATVLETGFGRDTFQVSLGDSATITQAQADASTVYVRPVRKLIRRTREGSQSVFVQHLPLTKVISLSLPDGEGGWTVLDADRYVFSGDRQEALSYSGEITLTSGSFPGGRDGSRFHPAGALIEYVAGEAVPPAELFYAMPRLLESAERRTRSSGMQSESYDYYSYSKLTADQVGSLFGEADKIIRELSIPA